MVHATTTKAFLSHQVNIIHLFCSHIEGSTTATHCYNHSVQYLQEETNMKQSVFSLLLCFHSVQIIS